MKNVSLLTQVRINKIETFSFYRLSFQILECEWIKSKVYDSAQLQLSFNLLQIVFKQVFKY